MRTGPADSSAVALTFHGSGDPALFLKLLEVARGLDVPLTVFAVGNWLDTNPELTGTILAAGHELANHTYTHPPMANLQRESVGSEFARCRDVLVRQAGLKPGWLRPSGVAIPSAMILDEAGRAGYSTVVGYDVDPRDYQDPGAAVVASRVVGALHAGAIVSLHAGHDATVAALTPITTTARSRGLKLVRVRDLLGSAI